MAIATGRTGVCTTWGRTAWRIIRSSWGVEVNVGLTLVNRLDNGCLSAAAGYEVELGVIAKVLELLTRLPLHLHAGDVLCGELVGILGTL